MLKHALGPMDRVDIALSKARGIAFVMSQVRTPEFKDEKLSSYCLWALNDLLDEAAETFEKDRLLTK